MHKVIQLILKKLYNKKCLFLWKYMFIGWTWWKPTHTKIIQFWNFEGRGCKAKIIMFNGWTKCLALGGIFNVFDHKSIYWYTTMYECENLSSSHELS
jgi:hypothetical protein